MKRRIALYGIVAIVLVAGIVWWQRDRIMPIVFGPRESSVPLATVDKPENIEVVAQNITTPWEVVMLPGGNLLVSEREGNLVRIGQDQKRYRIDKVRETSEGGLMGLALHPLFEQNNHIYVVATIEIDGALSNQVLRYTLENDAVTNKTVIIDSIPAGAVHDGGRIAFGPDNKLYVTTGDAGKQDTAQDTASLAGKILRVNDDGSIPSDNPFGNAVWSYGHRNPQGIAWDSERRLWSSEHGPSGAATGNDEINLIEKGANYGWPVIVGDQAREGMRTPILSSGDDDTWAPAGMVYHSSALYFTGLRGQALYKADIKSDDTLALSAYFKSEYGRLRALAKTNQALYLGTSNNDGRGTPRANDDKILALPWTIFN